MTTVKGALDVGWCEVTAAVVEPAVVQPGDPFRGSGVEGAPRASGLDHLRRAELVDQLRHEVVTGGPEVADLRRDPCVGSALGAPDGGSTQSP